MNNEQRRQTRIRLLREVYIRNNFNDRAVIRRAEKMGIAKRTINDYLKVVKAQVRSKMHV